MSSVVPSPYDVPDDKPSRSDGCFICGHSRKVVEHHIDGNRNNNTPDNLVYLCNSCHSRVHTGKDEKYQDWSQEVQHYTLNISTPTSLKDKIEIIAEESDTTVQSIVIEILEENIDDITMSNELEDVFGEEFAQSVQERTAERRQERNRVTEEQLREICSLAINENKFDPSEGDPMFSYTTENGMTHQVLLAMVPNPDNSEVWEHLSEPWDGAAKLPLDYLGEWYWSVFPDKKDVADLSQGDYVIVIGTIEEDEGDDGQIYKSIYPVRGIVTLDKAQKYAEQAGAMEFGDSEESESTESTEETSSSDDSTDSSSSSGLEDFASSSSDSSEDESSSSDSGGSGGSGIAALVGEDEVEEEEDDDEEEEEPVSYDDISHTVEAMADKQDDDDEPQIYEIEEGSPEHERITEIVIKNVDGVTEAQMKAVSGIVAEVIDEHSDDDDEEEEDDTSGTIF